MRDWASSLQPQTRDIYLVLGDNRFLLLQGHRHRLDIWWHHRSGLYHGLRWHNQLLTSGCSSFHSVLPLHCAHVLLFLFPFYSTTYLLLLMAPGISECLESSQVWCQQCYAPLMYYGVEPCSSPMWCVPKAYMALDLWSFQTTFLSGPYGVSLVVILVSLSSPCLPKCSSARVICLRLTPDETLSLR